MSEEKDKNLDKIGSEEPTEEVTKKIDTNENTVDKSKKVKNESNEDNLKDTSNVKGNLDDTPILDNTDVQEVTVLSDSDKLKKDSNETLIDDKKDIDESVKKDIQEDINISKGIEEINKEIDNTVGEIEKANKNITYIVYLMIAVIIMVSVWALYSASNNRDENLVEIKHEKIEETIEPNKDIEDKENAISIDLYNDTLESSIKNGNITELNINEFKNLEENKTEGVYYIGRPTCPTCREFLPTLTSVLSENNLKIGYVDTDKPKSVPEDLKVMNDLFKELKIEQVPSLVKISKDGKVNVFTGTNMLDRDNLTNFLK